MGRSGSAPREAGRRASANAGVILFDRCVLVAHLCGDERATRLLLDTETTSS